MKRFCIALIILAMAAPAYAACGSGGCGLGKRAKAVGGRVVRLVGRVLPRNR